MDIGQIDRVRISRVDPAPNREVRGDDRRFGALLYAREPMAADEAAEKAVTGRTRQKRKDADDLVALIAEMQRLEPSARTRLTGKILPPRQPDASAADDPASDPTKGEVDATALAAPLALPQVIAAPIAPPTPFVPPDASDATANSADDASAQTAFIGKISLAETLAGDAGETKPGDASMEGSPASPADIGFPVGEFVLPAVASDADAAQVAPLSAQVARLLAPSALSGFGLPASPVADDAEDAAIGMIADVAAPAPQPMPVPPAIVARPVAEASAPAAAPQVDTSRADWIEGMMEKVAEMRDAGGRSTLIRLLPDALGAIDVRIDRGGNGNTQVSFAAENLHARALLAESVPRLVEMAEARGLRFDQASVGGGQAGSRHPQDQQPQGRAPIATASPEVEIASASPRPVRGERIA